VTTTLAPILLIRELNQGAELAFVNTIRGACRRGMYPSGWHPINWRLESRRKQRRVIFVHNVTGNRSKAGRLARNARVGRFS
jgi:hypothetical protein